MKVKSYNRPALTSSPSTPGATPGPRSQAGARARTASATPSASAATFTAACTTSRQVQEYVKEEGGKVPCRRDGLRHRRRRATTICSNVHAPSATYNAVGHAVRRQSRPANRKFVAQPQRPLEGHLSRRAPSSPFKDGAADFVAVNETHVTEILGPVPRGKIRPSSRPRIACSSRGGYLVWGNAIPDRRPGSRASTTSTRSA